MDFCLPAKFDLKYVDSDGSKKTPVVIHRAILGTLDRFMALYLEMTKGNLPTWLAPVQAVVMPVNNQYHLDYSNEIYQLLLDNDIRVQLDSRDEKLSYRMREAQTKKIPYTIILGDKERDENLISYRLHGSNETNTMNKDEFIMYLKGQINDKK